MSARMSRRQALARLVVGGASAAMVGCVPFGSPEGAAPKPAGPAAARTGAPQRGGTLRLASATDLGHLEVQERTQRSVDMKYQTVDNLVSLDPDTLKPTPWLAESWEWSSDNRLLKLNLRKGVTYHSGRDFTSDDVKHNVLRARDPKLTAITTQFLTLSSWVTQMQLPDRNTIVLTFDKPRVGVLDMFDDWNMVDGQVQEDHQGRATIGGTGPFKFVEWRPGVSARWERNPNWWAAGADRKPHLDAVDVGFYTDARAMTAALEAGAVDVVSIPALRDAARLGTDPAYRLVSNDKSSGQVHTAAINVLKAPTNSKSIRQAMQFALDRQRCVANAMLGFGRVMELPFTAGTFAHDAQRTTTYAFDLDKAAALLKNVPRDLLGQPIVMLIDSARSESLQLGEIWKGDMEKVGLRVDLQVVQSQALADATRKQNVTNIQISGSAWANLEGVVALHLANRPWPAAPGRPGGPPFPTAANFYDQRYFDLTEQTSGEFDAPRRKALYAQISDLLLEEVNGLVIANRYLNWLSSNRVNGARFATTERVRWSEVWIGP